MKCFILAACLPLTLACAQAQTLSNAYPSCDLPRQRSLTGEIEGTIKDPELAHISMRANILEADIGNAGKARRINQDTANQMWRDVEHVRSDANMHAQKNGSLPAAERASFDRTLDSITVRVCRE